MKFNSKYFKKISKILLKIILFFSKIFKLKVKLLFLNKLKILKVLLSTCVF